MSAGHPLAGRESLTLDDYLRCSHVVVSISGAAQTVIDEYLRALGTPRRASLTLPFHAAAPLAVAGTALVATLPWRLAAPYAADPSVRLVPAPREVEHMSYLMAWHPRLDDDPAQRWLRDILRSVTGALPPVPVTGAT